MAAEDDADLERFVKDFDAWLREASQSGRYGKLTGIVTGWTLWIDRVNAEDGESWNTKLTAPGQSGTLTLGQIMSALIVQAQGWVEGD